VPPPPPSIVEASWSHSDTPHAVGLHWANDHTDARPLNDKIQNSQEADIQTPTEFEPEIPESERPQIHALDHVATGKILRKYFLKQRFKKQIDPTFNATATKH
jgi:hypothetical protein